jgi:hypothetical protein
MKTVSCIATVVAVSTLAACGGSSNNGPGADVAIPASVQPTQTIYAISVFAQAPGKLRPDDLLQMGSTLFVVYQDNNDNPDGTIVAGTSPQSEVIEYDMNGNVLQTFDVPGHPDGLLAYNATTVWVSSNEDANPVITIIDTTTNTLKTLTSDTAPLSSGGGLDDMKLVNGVVYASASNPALTTSPTPNLAPYSTDSSGATAEYGVNTGPGLYAITLNNDGTTFHAVPALMSSTPATLLPGKTPVTLNMTDPDSSAVDPDGDLVIDSQQDSELVFVSNIGTATQAVSVLPLTLYGTPWPVDDTRWSPATGNSFMLVADNPQGLIYRIDCPGGFPPSQAYSAGQGTVLQTDTTSGVMTPIYVGMNNPHGLIFIPY